MNIPPCYIPRVTINRLGETCRPFPDTLDTPEKLLRFWKEVVAVQDDHEPDKENLVVVIMDVRFRPTAWHRVSLGTLTETSAHPREVLRPVLLEAGHGFHIMHNHPGGDPEPSEADRRFTRRIREASEIMHVMLYDHVVVAESPVDPLKPRFSFREAGML